ncbi:MAG: restriction endonuclease subunit S [Candidatus Margulisbacteria bacterium]|nr:restriction endonuclease subunit S [Candidatus Margulisiibacteriota bacterium]MBU1626781.1 restriction endonuclease subunit S [bacterium]
MAKETKKMPKGYKQTDLGVIPKDWELKRLGDIGESIIGLTYSPNDVVPYGKLVHRSSNIQNNRLSYDDNVYVSKNIDDNLILRNNDILICVRNGSRELIGKSALIEGASVGETFGAFMTVFRSDKCQPFIFYMILSNVIQRQINQSLGATINQITNKTLNGFRFPCPKKDEEQAAIATVLSDTDALIERLEQLIAKKKAVKQGAMQQLLTGKKRLPGFSGEWGVKKLGKVVSSITTGKLDANAMVENGEYRFYTCAKNYYFIDKYAFDTEALLVSGNGANVGYIHYYKGKFNAYQRTYVLSDFSENILFTKLFMDRNLQERIRVEVNAGNTPYITMDTLSEMSIMFPPTIEEQAAIAVVLSDMDAEIEGLEQKRDKYIMIKQGMMRVLLTGKTRLV